MAKAAKSEHILDMVCKERAVKREAALKAILAVLGNLNDDDKKLVMRTCATFYDLDFEN